MKSHWKHHARFYVSALFGVIVWAATGRTHALRPVLAGDGFFAFYLASTALLMLRATPDHLRQRASYEDEGILLIVLLTLGAIAFWLVAILCVAERDRSRRGSAGRVHGRERAARLAHAPHDRGVPLRASLLRARGVWRCEGEDARGLAFPQTDEPASWTSSITRSSSA